MIPKTILTPRTLIPMGRAVDLPVSASFEAALKKTVCGQRAKLRNRLLNHYSCNWQTDCFGTKISAALALGTTRGEI
jgi:hypothetical protein